MDDEATDSGSPAKGRPDPSGHVEAGVTVYFPGDERDVVYIRIGREWVPYAKSVPCSAPLADIIDQFSGPRDKTTRATALELQHLHWAGHGAGSSQEITRASRHRVYYNPKERQDLFIVKDGEPPIGPLPVLDLDGHQEDPEPWFDPETGNRFTCDQARLITTLLKYAPREGQ